MSEPTQGQIKEFWEWCGLPYEGYGNADRLKAKSLPPIDLNNLFKYAVPKLKSLLRMTLRKIPDGYQWQIDRKPSYGGEFLIGEGITEALALFWALWQVKEKSSGSM